MTLSLKTIQRLLSLFFSFLIYLTGTQSVNAADLTNNLQPELSSKNLIKEEMMRNRPRSSCQQCFGPQGPTGCPGPMGPTGVAGLINIAAYENYFPTAVDAVGPTFLVNNPIPFNQQTVSSGNAIQSAFPFDTFTLAQGDYQIDVGLSNGSAGGGTTLAPTADLQLLVYLNDTSTPLFVWPASPTPADTDTPAFVSFSTIINVPTTSGTLKILPSATVTVTTGTPGSTVAYINIIQLNPPPISQCCVQQ